MAQALKDFEFFAGDLTEGANAGRAPGSEGGQLVAREVAKGSGALGVGDRQVVEPRKGLRGGVGGVRETGHAAKGG